jgi:hypothetical protein
MKLLSHYPHIDISIDFFQGFPGKLSVVYPYHEYVENVYVHCSLRLTPLNSSRYAFHVHKIFNCGSFVFINCFIIVQVYI